MKCFSDITVEFQNKGFCIVRNFLSDDICKILFKYCNIKSESIKYKIKNFNNLYEENWDGEFTDRQVPGVYSAYGDCLMESLLELSLDAMREITGLELLPNYSYWRLYTTNSELSKHIDRESCEISTSICLGYECADPQYVWDFFILDKTDNSALGIKLYPGDMIIYRGAEIPHWRTPFLGAKQAQLFLHYNDAGGKFRLKYDGRDMLGVSKYCNGKTST